MLPRVAAPEVVGPEEAALEQVLAQVLGLCRPDVGGADLRHHDERALEDRRIGELHHEVVRLAVGLAADARLGQLREPDRQVDVGARIVDLQPPPSPSLALREHDPAEVERAVEALRRRAADRLEEPRPRRRGGTAGRCAVATNSARAIAATAPRASAGPSTIRVFYSRGRPVDPGRACYDRPRTPLPSDGNDLHRERHHRPRRPRAGPQAARHVHRRRRLRRAASPRLGDPRQLRRRGDERLRLEHRGHAARGRHRRSRSQTTAAASRSTSIRRRRRARSR